MPKYIQSYIHNNGQIGVLVELQFRGCGTQKTDEFKRLALDVAMQIAATNPRVISPEDTNEVVPLMNGGGTQNDEEWGKESCLLTQSFVKAPHQTVKQYLEKAAEELGESIQVLRFARYDTNET